MASSKRIDQLISRILKTGDDDATHALLKAIDSGYPVATLRLLLESDNEGAVEAGAWIASELGEMVEPLIPQLSRLLCHPSKRVRFFVLDAVLNSGTPAHAEALAAAVERVQDDEDAVRWKSMNFLARATNEQLSASIPFISKGEVRDAIQWLIDAVESLDVEAVVRRLDDASHVNRIVAAAAAVRLASHDETALHRAVVCLDREINSFASEQVRLRWWR